jgi:alpha-D-ribose 1-methylphosphonate 5-triphosphate synthase subunit PhnH
MTGSLLAAATIEAGALAPGFADPVLDAQAVFRGVLEAMARPGRIVEVGRRLTPPAPLSAAAAAVVLTLIDQETPLWLDGAARPEAPFLRFHCGCPIVEDPRKGRFALISDARAMPALADFAQGSNEHPELAATLIIDTARLLSGVPSPQDWRLQGPGIDGEARLRVEGLPPDFADQWAHNHGRFPRGVDVVLCCGERLACLPRTTRLEA